MISLDTIGLGAHLRYVIYHWCWLVEISVSEGIRLNFPLWEEFYPGLPLELWTHEEGIAFCIETPPCRCLIQLREPCELLATTKGSVS